MSTTLLIVIIGSSILSALLLRAIFKKKSSHNHFNAGSSEPKTTNMEGVPAINAKAKKRPLIAVISFVLLAVMPIFFFTKGCSSDYHNVTFAIEENGKNYIFSTNEFLVKNAIEKNEVPPSLNSNVIYIVDDQIHMRPNDIEQAVHILSGNYKIIEKQEPSYNGYAVKDSTEVFESRTQNKAGSKIGETEIVYIATVSKFAPSKHTMEIKWKTTPSMEAISNCSAEDIWVVTNPHPGTTVGNWEEDVLVNIETINKFFNNSFELVYDEEAAVVYFKKIR